MSGSARQQGRDRSPPQPVQSALDLLHHRTGRRVAICDMQIAMRHCDPRTTIRDDMAKANLDRHAAHAVAAYRAGMSAG